MGPHPEKLGYKRSGARLRDLHFSQFLGATYAASLGTFGDTNMDLKIDAYEEMVSDQTLKTLLPL